MAEIPEHLLARSKARRAVLAGKSPDAASEATKTVADSAVAGGEIETLSGAGAPPAAVGAAAVSMDSPGEPPIIRDPKNHVPWWAWPALTVVPLLTVLYVGAFGQEKAEAGPKDPAVLGEQLFANNCSSCHGANGHGGVGPALWKGEVIKTFPEKYSLANGTAASGVEAQTAWIRGGSTTGLPYGDPNRDGGGRLSKGGMPAFGGQLSESEIEAVVTYERSKLG